MNTMETRLETLLRLCAGGESEEREALAALLRKLLEGGVPAPAKDPETQVREMLLELGAPDHLLGHDYVVEAILLVAEDRTYINNITFGLYPQLAAKFDTTAARVERAIRHLVEVTWIRGDIDVLGKYFGNTISLDKGKPTNGEFIARLANVLKQRIKQAA